MSDNADIRGPQDGNRININQDHEVRYWTEKFGCSEAALRAAVASAGVMADDVQRELQSSQARDR